MTPVCKTIPTQLGPILVAAHDDGLARKEALLRLEGVSQWNAA